MGRVIFMDGEWEAGISDWKAREIPHGGWDGSGREVSGEEWNDPAQKGEAGELLWGDCFGSSDQHQKKMNWFG